MQLGILYTSSDILILTTEFGWPPIYAGKKPALKYLRTNFTKHKTTYLYFISYFSGDYIENLLQEYGI